MVEIIRTLLLDLVPQIVFPRQATALWILHTSLSLPTPPAKMWWNRSLWAGLETYHFYIAYMGTSTWNYIPNLRIFGCSPFVNGQFAKITAVTSLVFWRTELLKSEIVVLFLAGCISPGTDVKGSTSLTLRIQALYCTYVLGMNWTMKVKQKAILFLQRYLSLLEMRLTFLMSLNCYYHQ